MIRENIYIASDHAGFTLKNQLCKLLEKNKKKYIDLGCRDDQSCDYASYAQLLATTMDKDKDFGVLICGSGIGISIAANRHKGVRAALCSEPFTAQLAREHNDANVLVLAGRLIAKDMAYKIFELFINTPFEGGRHQRRIEKIEEFK